MSDQGEEPDLDGMAGSYRAQTGHLTRTIKTASALVKEAALCAPNMVFLDQLKRALAGVLDQEAKCALFARTSGMLRSGQRTTRTTSRGP
jgi:hypothetical protein